MTIYYTKEVKKIDKRMLSVSKFEMKHADATANY